MGANVRSIYVCGLHPLTTPAELEDCFRACGSINRVTVLTDSYTGQPRGAAFLEFRHAHCVQNALLLNGSAFKGQNLTVVQKVTKGKGKGKDKSKFKGKEMCKDAGTDIEQFKGKGKDFD